MNDPGAPTGAAPDRGRWYWFRQNVKKRWGGFVTRHRRVFLLSGAVLFALLVLMRASVHPLVIGLRANIFVLTVGVPVVLALWYLLRRRSWALRAAVFAALAVLVAGIWISGFSPHEYLALYSRYRSLDLRELEALPLTAHDRIQPHNSIVSLANEAMAETESPTQPDFVRVGTSYRWTLGIEPAYTIRRATGGVKELFNVSGTAPSPNFSRESRVNVDFPTGEGLMLWNNTFVNTVRAFGPWRFFNYEPADVKYIPDDKGQWVQAVSLIRWKGLLFPRPEFGGVHILRQSSQGGNSPLRALLGTGRWIPPEDVEKFPWLRGQNLVPYKVSRTIANSLRFQNGFLAPFPGYHLGDIRIPDLPDDVNPQPFTIYFDFPGTDGPPDKLYHYFALEPFQADKQGLNTSLFIPADDPSRVYTYTHHRKNEALTGVSAIGPKVMESKKNYDWSRNRPVEHRPYIKQIAGRPRFFWLTTVVTLKDTNSSFIAGSTPDVALTDAAYKVVTWVNPLKPEEWTAQLEKEMAEVWSHEGTDGGQ